jgi:hypothetical protein
LLAFLSFVVDVDIVVGKAVEGGKDEEGKKVLPRVYACARARSSCRGLRQLPLAAASVVRFFQFFAAKGVQEGLELLSSATMDSTFAAAEVVDDFPPVKTRLNV